MRSEGRRTTLASTPTRAPAIVPSSVNVAPATSNDPGTLSPAAMRVSRVTKRKSRRARKRSRRGSRSTSPLPVNTIPCPRPIAGQEDRSAARKRPRLIPSKGEEVRKEPLAVFARNRLGVELNAPHRVCPMANGLDLIFPPRLLRPRQDLQFGRQANPVDDEGMVAGDVQRRRQTPEHGLARVADRRDLAVHDAPCADHASAVCRADRLMPEAYAEDRSGRPETADALDAHPGLRGCARTGRDDDPAGLHGVDLFDRDLVVPPNDRI